MRTPHELVSLPEAVLMATRQARQMSGGTLLELGSMRLHDLCPGCHACPGPPTMLKEV